MVNWTPPTSVPVGRLGMLKVRVAFGGAFTETETRLEVAELFAVSYALAVRVYVPFGTTNVFQLKL